MFWVLINKKSHDRWNLCFHLSEVSPLGQLTKSQCWKVTGRAICQEGADRWDPISHALNGPVAAGAKLELRENNGVQREKRFHVFIFKASSNPAKLLTSTEGRAGNLDKSSSFCAASPVTAHSYPPPHLLRGKPIGHGDGDRP